MMQARRASMLVIGAMAAVAIGGGVALASSGGDDAGTPSRAAITDALADDASPSPSRSADDSPSPSRSAGDDGAETGFGSPSTSAPAGGSAVSVAQAKAIAISAAGGGRVTKVERETEHGRAVWDVEVISGGIEHDIDVDRQTGAVLRHETDRDDDDGRGRGGDDD
jgi:uncharacterized membrane protein YkoI